MSRAATVKVWWIDDRDDVEQGYTPGSVENLKTLRVGPVAICWGLDGDPR